MQVSSSVRCTKQYISKIPKVQKSKRLNVASFMFWRIKCQPQSDVSLPRNSTAAASRHPVHLRPASEQHLVVAKRKTQWWNRKQKTQWRKVHLRPVKLKPNPVHLRTVPEQHPASGETENTVEKRQTQTQSTFHQHCNNITFYFESEATDGETDWINKQQSLAKANTQNPKSNHNHKVQEPTLNSCSEVNTQKGMTRATFLEEKIRKSKSISSLRPATSALISGSNFPVKENIKCR